MKIRIALFPSLADAQDALDGSPASAALGVDAFFVWSEALWGLAVPEEAWDKISALPGFSRWVEEAHERTKGQCP